MPALGCVVVPDARRGSLCGDLQGQAALPLLQAAVRRLRGGGALQREAALLAPRLGDGSGRPGPDALVGRRGEPPSRQVNRGAGAPRSGAGPRVPPRGFALAAPIGRREPSPVQQPRSRPDEATARMTPKSLGLLILFLWVQRAANDSVVTGIMGSTVELRCHYPEKDSFIFNTFRIQWQKKGVDACFVDAYFPNQDMKEHQCNEFVNRTQIEMQLKDGNFSLKLLHIGLNDALTYECMLQGNRDGIFRLIYHANITLKVAAYYSKPVLTGPVQSGEEMTFFCNSSHGYPQQKLYWINQTDNSILNAKENFTEEPDGTFSVYSTLTVKAASDIKLGCTIENEQLHQNITTTIDLSIPTSSPISDLHQDKTTTIVLSAVAAAVGIVVIFILYNWWNKKKPSLQRTYRDVCENEEAAHPNAPV